MEQMDKKEILDILDNAKDEKGSVPMRLVRQALDKLPTIQPVATDINVGDKISRQAAIEAVSEACFELRGVFGRCEDAVNALPSAQKKGHWIDEETNYLCSECHRGCWVNSDYCPWCGADMRGIQE